MYALRVTVAALWLFIATTAFADAQAAFSLSSVTIDANSDRLIHLGFTGPLPQISIRQSDPAEISIILYPGQASPELRLPRVSGPIKALHVLPNGQSLLVEVTLSSPGTVDISKTRNGYDALVTLVGSPTNTGLAVAPVSTGGSSSELVPVRYLSAAEIFGVFGVANASQSFQPSAPLQTSMPTYGGASIPTAALPQSPVADIVAPASAVRLNEHVVYDRRINALLLTGTASEVADLKRQIALLDVPDAPMQSVVLEAQIVELSDNAARHIGLEFNGGALATGSEQSANGTLPTASFSLQAQLFAQIGQGQGKLIATPRVQTANDTGASILTGDALPILTSITYPGNPPIIQQQLQYVNVGVHLQIVPHVTADGFVVSRIVAEVSNVTSFIAGNIPQISQRQAVATARVRDGEPFVIGGLLQNNDLAQMSKIPVLGDLPVLGSLFRLRNDLKENTNLYIIVTPHIMQRQAGP